MKIQNKITLLFLVLSTGILVLLNAFIFYFEYKFNYEDFFKRLETRVNIMSRVRLHPDAESRAYQEVRNHYLERLDHEKEQLLQADSDGRFKEEGLPKTLIKEILRNGTARYRSKSKFFAGKFISQKTSKFIVVVSASNPYGLREINELRRILLYGFIGAILVAFAVGKVFSYYTFMPVRKLTEEVNLITSDNLHSRLETTKSKDEIAELTRTFNSMINRLDTAFATQTNFVSNASHELRTPLTIINGEVELALNQPDPTGGQHAVLQTIRTETDKLIQIINNLLLLAQSGFDGKKQNWQKVRMDELLWLAIASSKKIYPDSNIEVDHLNLPDNEQMLHVRGNDNLLRLAITNIISNACKYSKNKLVTVKLAAEQSQLLIDVADEGIGIPEADLKHIFEPFFRASNTYAYEGHGVGLALTFNIIRQHNGTINIQSEVGSGTRVQIILPIAEPQ
jgi:signal transduction histidine kinase